MTLSSARPRRRGALACAALTAATLSLTPAPAGAQVQPVTVTRGKVAVVRANPCVTSIGTSRVGREECGHLAVQSMKVSGTTPTGAQWRVDGAAKIPCDAARRRCPPKAPAANWFTVTSTTTIPTAVCPQFVVQVTHVDLSTGSTWLEVRPGTFTGKAACASPAVAQVARMVIGLPVEQAIAHIEAARFLARVVEIDGEPLALSQDARPNRINLVVDAGVVTATRVG